MRDFRITVGSAFVGILVAISLIVVPSALAALPEFSETTGFKGIGTKAALLETEAGAQITCQESETNSNAAENAEFTKKTKLATGFHLTFKKCKNAGNNCTSKGANAGEINTEKLEAELGYLPGGVKGAAKAAFAFRPPGAATLIAEFKCALVDEVRGCIVATIEPTNKPGKQFSLSFEEAAGAKQKYTSYEKTEGAGATECKATIELGGAKAIKFGLGVPQQIVTCPNMEEIKD